MTFVPRCLLLVLQLRASSTGASTSTVRLIRLAAELFSPIRHEETKGTTGSSGAAVAPISAVVDRFSVFLLLLLLLVLLLLLRLFLLLQRRRLFLHGAAGTCTCGRWIRGG